MLSYHSLQTSSQKVKGIKKKKPIKSTSVDYMKMQETSKQCSGATDASWMRVTRNGWLPSLLLKSVSAS